MTRLEELKAKLAARTDAAGKPRQGYAENVKALNEEIAKLENTNGN